MTGPESTSSDTSVASEVLPSALWTGRLLLHLRKPENLLTWMVLTAWMKFMGIATHIPTITVG